MTGSVNCLEEILNLPYCIRPIDEKHIAIKSLLNIGAIYYNHSVFFSTILIAICDARYVFNLVDVGNYGSNNYCGVFRNSALGKAISTMKLIY